MNKSIIRLIILIIMTLSFSQMEAVSAAGNEAEIIFKDNEIIYNPDNKVFMEHLNLIPGERYNNSLKVYNESTYIYDLYLQLSLPENDEEGLKLLDYIQMDIIYEDEIIYSGNVKGNEGINGKEPGERYLLGIFDPLDQGEINVVIKVSEELTKENINAYGETEWKLVAVAYEKQVGGEETEEEPEEVKEEETVITPGGNPKTGDESSLLPYMLFMVGALGSGLVLLAKDKKRVNK
ncbi:MAG: sortase B protein-sorting domain-containing protein [Clostridiaceae bacterium]